MDGADISGAASRNRVVVMGATNRSNSIDEALRRPGRFDREVEIGELYPGVDMVGIIIHPRCSGIPSAQSRLEILTALLRNVPHSLSESDIANVAASTHGYVGADLSAVCREAGLKTIKRLTANVRGDPSQIADSGTFRMSP